MTTFEAQRILLVDQFLPLHDRASGGLRQFELVKLLVEDGHKVTYMTHEMRADHEQYGIELCALGVNVVMPPVGLSIHEDTFAQLLRNGRFDTALLAPYEVAQEYIGWIRAHSASTRVVIDTVDLHFVRLQRRAEATGRADHMDAALKAHAEELATYATADELIAISNVEQALLHSLLPGKPVHVVGNVHNVVPSSVSFENRSGLLFVGGFAHAPNAQGVLWFLESVLPRVRESLGDIPVHIVGQDPPTAFASFAERGVKVHGWMPRVDLLLQTSRLSIAPLLFGAGLKGKVGEALAAGLPVVTTSIGAEGLGLNHGEDALIADSPEAFADAVIAAYRTPELWSRLATNGREAINRSFTVDAARGALRTVVLPSASARMSLFGVPDWRDAAAAKAALDWYVRSFADSSSSTLGLGIVDDAISEDDAMTLVIHWLEELGHNPETIPDLAITPLSSQALASLPADTMWLSLSPTPRPTHLHELPASLSTL